MLLALGFVQLKRGDYGLAREHLQHSLVIARQIDKPALVAELLQHLGTVANDTASYDKAHARYDESLRIARGHADWKRVTEVLFYQAVMHDQQSRFDEAERCGSEGLAIAQRVGHREFVAAHTGGLGVIACKRGQMSDGIEQVHEALALAQEIGFGEGVALFNFVLGYAYSSLKNVTQARRMYEQGLSVACRIGDSRSTIMLQSVLGELMAREGDTTNGLVATDDAVALARRARHGHELSFALEQRASVKVLVRDLDGAVSDCTEAITWAQRIHSTEREAFVLARLALVCLAAQAGAGCQNRRAVFDDAAAHWLWHRADCGVFGAEQGDAEGERVSG